MEQERLKQEALERDENLREGPPLLVWESDWLAVFATHPEPVSESCSRPAGASAERACVVLPREASEGFALHRGAFCAVALCVTFWLLHMLSQHLVVEMSSDNPRPQFFWQSPLSLP
jgi:hypothetical protein